MNIEHWPLANLYPKMATFGKMHIFTIIYYLSPRILVRLHQWLFIFLGIFWEKWKFHLGLGATGLTSWGLEVAAVSSSLEELEEEWYEGEGESREDEGKCWKDKHK